MSAQLLDTPHKHSWSLVSLADAAFHHAKEFAFASSWPSLINIAESAVVALMERIDKGQLRILTPSRTYIFPRPGSSAERNNPMPDLKAELRVIDDSFWLRLCTMSDLGFAEAYMYGNVQCDDLPALFKMFVYNRDSISSLNSTASYLFNIPAKLTTYRFLNTITNSRSNISAHYDISNTMFQGLLSKDMTYSCAIFSELDADLAPADKFPARKLWDSPNTYEPLHHRDSSPSSSPPPEYAAADDLHSAQIRKLRHIINKAQIRPGNRVLEIGSGWGSLAIMIAQLIPDTQIDSLTLSVAQRELAMQRIREEGLQDRIRIHLLDYRDMPPEWKGTFDRFVSVEMLEAVGQEFIATFWERVEWALKPRNSVGVVQCITLPEPRFEQYCREVDFIRKWVVFPGSFIPSVSCILQGLTTGSHSRLVMDSISNIGPHYARTLREWQRRFLDKFDTVIAPALRAEYPDVMSGATGREESEVFKRKWIYYYCYCEVGFTMRIIGDHIITFTRDGNEEFACQVYE